MVELNAILMKMGRHPSYSVQYPADMGRKFAKYNNNNNNNNTNTNNNNTRHVKGGHGVIENSLLQSVLLSEFLYNLISNISP